MGSNQLYSLSWGEFSSCLSTTVQGLRGDNEMVDVTLAAGGRIFPAHKLVLSAASPLLMQMLKSTQCSHPVLMLAGITAADMEALLQFVYQGQVCVQSNQLPSLLQAAHFLDIQALSPQAISGKSNKQQPTSANDAPTEATNTAPPIHPATNRDVSTSPQLPVRKRRRKQVSSSDQEEFRWSPNDRVDAEMVENHQFEHVLVDKPLDDTLKCESIDDQEDSSLGKKLVSDLPVECTICGVTLRQSRNLRRHMELIHLKMENGGKLKKTLMKDDASKCEEDPLQIPQPPPNQVHVHRTVKSVQTSVQSVQTMTRVYEGPLDQAGPSRVAVVPSSHMLTNLPPQIVSSQSQAVHMPKFLTSHILISSPSAQVPSSHSKIPTSHILTSQNSQLVAPQILSSHTSSAKVQTSHVLSAPLQSSQMIPQVPISSTSKHQSHILNSSPPSSQNTTLQIPTSHVLVQKNPTQIPSSSSSQIATVKIPTSQILTSPPPTSQMAQLLTPHILTSPPSHVPPSHVPPSPTHILPSSAMYQAHGNNQNIPYSHANVHSMQFPHNNLNDATFRQHQVDLLRNAGLYADTREHCTTE